MTIKRYVFTLSLLPLLLACQFNISKQNSNNNNNNLLQHSAQDTLVNALKIAYVGNMGVCIESGNKTVIIDGLHQFYNKEYVYPTKNMVNELINGKFKKFSAIEFSLFTHFHGDHFSGEYSKKFLENNSEGTIVGSYQIKESINKLLSEVDSISHMINVVSYNKKPHVIEKYGIKITAIQCDHSSPEYHGETENIAYVVTIDDYNILHVGDTDWDLTLEPFKTLDLKSRKLDIAVLPYWLLLEKGAVTKVNTLISPKHIIATHIPPNFSKRYQKQLHNKFSNITLLTSLGEVHYYKKD